MSKRIKPTILAGLGLFLFMTVSGGVALGQESRKPDPYFRLSLMYEQTLDARFSDRRCNPASGLVPYFGCVDGNDGRPIGAYGDFGGGFGGEVALGLRLHPVLRVEAAFAHQGSLEFQGNANFLKAGSLEPVRGDVSQNRFNVRGYLDIAPLLKVDLGVFEPFVGAGIGVAWNKIKTMTYEFPELAKQPALTTVPGGSHTSMMWITLVGTAIRITPKTFIDMAWTYSDYGRVRTSAGAIDVVRGGVSVAQIPVEATEAKLRSHGFMLGLRRHF